MSITRKCVFPETDISYRREALGLEEVFGESGDDTSYLLRVTGNTESSGGAGYTEEQTPYDRICAWIVQATEGQVRVVTETPVTHEQDEFAGIGLDDLEYMDLTDEERAAAHEYISEQIDNAMRLQAEADPNSPHAEDAIVVFSGDNDNIVHGLKRHGETRELTTDQANLLAALIVRVLVNDSVYMPQLEV